MPHKREVPLAQIVDYLDRLLDVSKYDEGEPANGLMLDAARPVTQLAAAVNTSFMSIRSAAAIGAELLLVHHPTSPNIDLALHKQKREAMRDAGVSLYGAHASLDAHPDFSNSDTLARRLGITLEGRFAPYCGGLAGAYGDVAGSFDEFTERARSELGVLVDAWQNSESFRRVGIVAGGAPWTSFVDEARLLGCDTYMTGEGSMYTKLFARETGMNLIFGTHYATERYGIQVLTERVAAEFELPWTFVTEDPDIL
jgi:dinuclear metal center YbgI/SA1388 family protein